MKKEFFEGAISVWDLPGWVQCVINDSFKDKIFDQIKNEKRIDLAKKLNENVRSRVFVNLKRLEAGKRVPLSFIIKITCYTKMSQELEKNIILLYSRGRNTKYIKYPNLPFNFKTPEGAKIISAILHDGYLGDNSISYTKIKATNEEEKRRILRDFKECAESIFGKIEPPKEGWNSQFSKGTVTIPAITSVIVSIFLNRKKKIKGEEYYPKFIHSKELARHYLRKAFDDDGSVYFKGDRKAIVMKLVTKDPKKIKTKKPSELLLKNAELLKSLGISSEINYKGVRKGHVWQLTIQGQKNLKEFYRLVGFDLKYKSDKLEAAILSYKQTQYKSSDTEREFLKNAYIIQLTKGYFTIQSLSKRAQRSDGRTGVVIKELVDKKYFKMIQKKGMIGHGGKSQLKGFLPAKFKVTERGRKRIIVVFIGGVFDLLHPGHLVTINTSKRLGDILVVVISRDERVKIMKGRYPINKEEIRQKMISSFRNVDLSILGSKNSIMNSVKRIRPDIIALGYDQEIDEKWLQKRAKESGLDIQIVRIKEELKGFKSTDIRNKIASGMKKQEN